MIYLSYNAQYSKFSSTVIQQCGKMHIASAFKCTDYLLDTCFNIVDEWRVTRYILHNIFDTLLTIQLLATHYSDTYNFNNYIDKIF